MVTSETCFTQPYEMADESAKTAQLHMAGVWTVSSDTAFSDTGHGSAAVLNQTARRCSRRFQSLGEMSERKAGHRASYSFGVSSLRCMQ